jgi:hypothetical protein
MYARLWNMPIHLYAHILFCANPALMDAKTLISSLLDRANQTCKCHSNRTWASKQHLIITTTLLKLQHHCLQQQQQQQQQATTKGSICVPSNMNCNIWIIRYSFSPNPSVWSLIGPISTFDHTRLA